MFCASWKWNAGKKHSGFSNGIAKPIGFLSGTLPPPQFGMKYLVSDLSGMVHGAVRFRSQDSGTKPKIKRKGELYYDIDKQKD